MSKISIITPTLNASKYLNQCLASVHSQGCNLEHIIVDGGSTDSTIDIVKGWQTYHPIGLLQGKDKGVGDAINKGFKAASGDIFGWLDADDYYNPGALESVTQFFNLNRNAMFVYGGVDIVDENGQPYQIPVMYSHFRQDHILTFDIRLFDAKEALEKWAAIVFCGVFYWRQVIDTVGGFNDLGNDLDFWLRVNEHFMMYPMPTEIWGNYRIHNGSISLSERGEAIRERRIKEDWLLAWKYHANPFAWRPRRYPLMLASKIYRVFVKHGG